MDSPEDIPAFSMWKTLLETLPEIVNMESSAQNFNIFKNIVSSPEFLEMFMCNMNSTMSLSKYRELCGIYKAFTVSLLGKFFYLLSQDNLLRIHTLLIEAQQGILHKISTTESHIYHELTSEYISVMRQLNGYMLSGYTNKITVEAFTPEEHKDLKNILNTTPMIIEIGTKNMCQKMQIVTLKFISEIIRNKLMLNAKDRATRDVFDNLLCILKNADVKLKIGVLRIFVRIFEISDEATLNDLRVYFNQFYSVFAVLLSIMCLSEDIEEAESFQEVCAQLLSCDKFRKSETCKFILKQAGTNKKLAVHSDLLQLCIVNVGEDFYVEDIGLKHCHFVAKNVVSNMKDMSVADCYKWKGFSEALRNVLISEFCRSDKCTLNENLNGVVSYFKACVIMKFTAFPKGRLKMLDESDFFPEFLSFITTHSKSCFTEEATNKIAEILIYFQLVCNCSHVNSMVYMQIICFPFLRKFNSTLPVNYDCYNKAIIIQRIKELYSVYDKLSFNEGQLLELICLFLRVVSVEFECDAFGGVEMFVQLFKAVMDNGDIAEIRTIIKDFPCLLSICKNPEGFLNEFILKTLRSPHKPITLESLNILPEIITILSSKYVIVMEKNCCYTPRNLKFKFVPANEDVKEDSLRIIVRERKMKNIDSESVTAALIKSIIMLVQNKDENVRVKVVAALPVLANNVALFHQVIITKWIKLIVDDSIIVRRSFAKALKDIINFDQNNYDLKNEAREKILNSVFVELKNSAKVSLSTKYEIQETLLAAIENLCDLTDESIPFNVIKLVLFFTILHTSKHAYYAVCIIKQLARRNSTTAHKLYWKYKRDLFELIVNLCVINRTTKGWDLRTSLENVSLMFDFFGPKYLLLEDTRYLLPFLVSFVVKVPNVRELIEEVALVNEVDLGELLQAKYGYIFLHIYLKEPDNQKCLEFVERSSGMDGTSLRKRNFMIILNELLLHFHDKKERVLLALKRLAREDSNNANSSIPEFLVPKFLGVLQYFDMKLVPPHFNRESVLLSLAQLFKFMGPKHISPLRFKIIAMLRTALNLNTGKYPELNCDLWEAFVHSCDIELLGPQLATIFVSILPLRTSNLEKITSIFKYLVVQNERMLREYIPDLFFILEFDDLDDDVLNRVSVPVRKIQEEKSFKEHLKYFMKYLSYEAVEVKVHALRYIKKLLEKSRQEVDEMVLGYNGIDGVIVELIDALTLGCRENDKDLRLACGDCIGELSAIEPSHLPRTCTQEQYSFNFYINEPAFIVSSLTELIRALQAQKNTQNMDRFALAIQETLKTYEISPDKSKNMHDLWNLFTESHQELMLPLLSSKYTMAQTLESINVSPIYGSNFGTTFQTWLYSWTVSLITIIKSDKKPLFHVYLPSMKQDQKTLMHFLPYILLYALTESSQNEQQQIFKEFSAVLDSQNKNRLSENILNVRPIRSENFTSFDQISLQTTHKYEQYTKVIFVLFDFLNRWLREWIWDKGYEGQNNDMYKKIKVFLTSFCKLQLAKCNFACGEYPRALMYLEDYLEKNKGYLDENLALLEEIYYRLDEPDGVAGVTALRHYEPSLEQRVLGLEVAGKFSDVAACYDKLISSTTVKLNHIQGLNRCYFDLDYVDTVLNYAEGAMTRQPQYQNIMLDTQAEALWRLGSWDELEKLVQKNEVNDNVSWNLGIGQSLLAMKNCERDDFKKHLTNLKLQQVNALGAASLEEGAYQHGYYYISRLHALNELEQVEKLIHELLLRPNDRNVCVRAINQLKMEWDLRFKVVQQSFRITEPILCLRRVAVQRAKDVIKERVPSSVDLFDKVLGDLWLKSAEIARSTELRQQAFTYILKAEEYSPKKLFLEKAKLQWNRDEHTQALSTLKRGLSFLLPEGNANTGNSSINKLNIEDKKLCAEAKLLIASYNNLISNVHTDMNIQHYKEAVEMFKECEKSLVFLGQYYDRLFQNYSDDDRDSVGTTIQIHMINCFGKSLLYGTNYVYQSMPRLLSIWFDYGTRILSVTVSKLKEERKSELLKMTKFIDNFLERLPTYIFLTAFSQLISRICHPQKEVYLELKSIIIKLISQYPQQTLWMMISVIKSSYPVRMKRCREIFSDSRLENPTMIKFVTDFTKLAERLIELCNKDISDTKHTASVNALMRSLPRLLQKEDFSQIMIPTQMFRKLVLPNPDFANSQHNPFPNHYVHIVGIEDSMVLLSSMQRPKRITLRGSDGKGYMQLLKPKDDLRKDFRLMEFNDIVNQLLSREDESRQRRLHIRLYSVAPLNEECGMIEWIDNLVGLRNILLTLYKQRGLGLTKKEYRDTSCRLLDTLETKRNVFLNKLLPRHPPIMGDWYKKTFPDAQGWLTARTAYIHTTAVISMVGYILGLGDRHGENILFDTTSGDTVHVDFNCLFNKGEQLEYPERVPFRLTHNMVTAMGPLGVEGLFRKSCECTLRVLRTHTNTLMSIVTPFVYDPLVSWAKQVKSDASNLYSEQTNGSALESIKNIRCRLEGQVRMKNRSYSIPLSVEGQANCLITEAVNVDNLCQMYMGWGPYL